MYIAITFFNYTSFEKGGGGLGGGTDFDMTLSPVLDLSEEGKEGALKEEFFPFNLMSSGPTKQSSSTLLLEGWGGQI